MCNDENVNNLQRLLVEYEEAKRFFDETKTHSGTSIVINPEEICGSIKALYKLKHTGNNIKMLYECQHKSRKKEYKNTEYIHKSIANRGNVNEDKTDKKKVKDSDNKKTQDSHKKTRGSDKKSIPSDREGSKDQRRGKFL